MLDIWHYQHKPNSNDTINFFEAIKCIVKRLNSTDLNSCSPIQITYKIILLQQGGQTYQILILYLSTTPKLYSDYFLLIFSVQQLLSRHPPLYMAYFQEKLLRDVPNSSQREQFSTGYIICHKAF